MRKIKITRGGCGITSKDASGNTRHTLKTEEHPPFECDDAQADRLVRLGVAKYVGAADAAEPDAQQEKPDAQAAQKPEKVTVHLDAADLETWDYNDLKRLAADMGVKPAGQKKADYIAAIVAEEVEVDMDEPDELDDDEMPVLSTADPE